MDPKKKPTNEIMANSGFYGGILKQFRDNTSNIIPETNFLGSNFNINGNFAANMPDPNQDMPIVGANETLVEGARGYVPKKKEEKVPVKPEDKEVEEEVNEEEMPETSGVSNVRDDGSGTPTPESASRAVSDFENKILRGKGGGAGEITTQKQRVDAFLGLGDPARIEKRGEIKDARQENRATNRLRRRTKNMPDKEKKAAGVEKIPSRKTAKETKKKRLNAAKVKYDKQLVEKTKAKPETKKEN